MEDENIVLAADAIKTLKISRVVFMLKARNFGILQWSKTFKRHYVYKKDLEHFKVDYRKKENRRSKNEG